MTEERWQHIQDLFDAALQRTGSERAAYLEEVCRGDAALRKEVDSLLKAFSGTGRFDRMAARFGVADASASPEPEPAVRIGPYRVLRALGKGGMGVVYLAERDDEHYQQRVALKVFHAGLHREELIQRFIAERQILAQLEHPNIARLLFGGVTPDDRPYFALEYVEGQPLTAYCDAHHIGVEARLQMFL